MKNVKEREHWQAEETTARLNAAKVKLQNTKTAGEYGELAEEFTDIAEAFVSLPSSFDVKRQVEECGKCCMACLERQARCEKRRVTIRHCIGAIIGGIIGAGVIILSGIFGSSILDGSILGNSIGVGIIILGSTIGGGIIGGSIIGSGGGGVIGGGIGGVLGGIIGGVIGGGGIVGYIISGIVGAIIGGIKENDVKKTGFFGVWALVLISAALLALLFTS